MTTNYPVRLEQADGPHGEGGERHDGGAGA